MDPSATVAEAAPPPETFTPPAEVKITPREAPKEEAKKPSLKETLAAAKAKVEAKEAAEAPKEVKTERPRGEHGHFTADPSKTDAENEAARVAAEKATKTPAKVDPTDHKQPLQRFSQAAKDAWPTVPEEAQKEIHRAFREVEAGLTKHRDGSTRYGEVFKEFDDIAKASNVDAKATLQSYVNIDRALHSGNPQHIVGAINEVLKSAGVTPQQYAQAIMGNKSATDQQQPGNAPPSREVTELRETVKRLEQKLGGVEQHLQGETMTKHEQTLTEWSADKPHFNDLRSEVTRLVKDEGLSPDDAYASALVAAQDKARAFLGNEASAASRDNPLQKAAEELAEQIDRGSKSITGAPSAGSEPPPHTGPLPSIKESLRKARLKASA